MMDRRSLILATIAALASSGGFWQFAERAAFETQATACGQSVVALANAVAAQ